MAKRHMKLGMSMRGLGYHVSAWRHPATPADGTLRFDHYVRNAQLAEQGLFDMIFFADGIGVREKDLPRGSLARSGYEIVEMEPMTLLPALAAVTQHIGLVSTASTTYNEPYNLARRFSSIDHVSNGRAGWNIVTTAGVDAAQNFGLDDVPAHRQRYERASEFLDVCLKLWDSWEDDFLIGDKVSGKFADGDKIHRIDHQGQFYRVRGPLNVPPSPQRHPLLVQAGSSDDGRAFAARYAEAVF